MPTFLYRYWDWHPMLPWQRNIQGAAGPTPLFCRLPDRLRVAIGDGHDSEMTERCRADRHDQDKYRHAVTRPADGDDCQDVGCHHCFSVRQMCDDPDLQNIGLQDVKIVLSKIVDFC